MTEPCDLTAVEARRRIDRGDLTADALVRSCLDRIAAREPEVEAWEHLDRAAALAAARQADSGQGGGTLRGLPFAAKDVIETADMPTTYGSPIYAGHRTAWDAACVAMARNAGGILIGKTVTAEFAHRAPGKTRNPWNPGHTPGGSSSGSAAAVACGMVPLAMGTQTGGSVIRPAAYCGVVGYKGSFGEFCLFGVREQTRSFDTLGLFGRTVADVALFRSGLLGEAPVPLAAVDGAALRIGLCRTMFWDQAEPAVQALIEDCARRLEAAGATVTDFTLPPVFRELKESSRWISAWEMPRAFAYEIANHRDKISKDMLEGRVADGANCTYDLYVGGLEKQREAQRSLLDAMKDIDVLITPSTPGEAPEGLASTGTSLFNAFWTEAGVPTISLPAGRGPKQLPLGVQLVGHRHRDRALLEAAAWAAGVLA
ncbi:MAG: amidase [Acetobacterales bacterium]